MMRIAVLFILIFLVPQLQGCFPLAAGGAVGGAIMASDRRTSGAYVEDQEIEIKAASRIGEKLGDSVHVNVTSFNRNVLLTGEAPSAEAKKQVEESVRGVLNVRGISNEVAIAGNSSFASRTNDAYLTSKIKARYIDANKFQALYVKVVTEDGVAYLLGLVTHQEADDAVEITRTTSGVRKVVKIFEYLD
ncbi:MAG: BON domain-containing protein [Sulfuricellaceae bacterium]|nr:BON domain-containing protein [Sulfuricellaceae bacterium]